MQQIQQIKDNIDIITIRTYQIQQDCITHMIPQKIMKNVMGNDIVDQKIQTQ